MKTQTLNLRRALVLCSSFSLISCGSDAEESSAKAQEARVGPSLEERVEELERIVQDQSQIIESSRRLLERLGVDDNGDLIVSGANLRVVNGEDSQESVNGKGNLIVGYQSAPAGSHNLLLGQGNRADSFGGIVGGTHNRLMAPYASILTGLGNSAFADRAVILTGDSISVGEGNGSVAVTSGVGLKLEGQLFWHKTVIGMGQAGFAAQPWQGNAGLVITDDYRP